MPFFFKYTVFIHFSFLSKSPSAHPMVQTWRSIIFFTNSPFLGKKVSYEVTCNKLYHCAFHPLGNNSLGNLPSVQSTPWNTFRLKLIAAQLVKKVPVFVTPSVSLSCSIEHANRPYLQPDNPVHTLAPHSIKKHFNITFPSISRSRKLPLSFGFSQ